MAYVRTHDITTYVHWRSLTVLVGGISGGGEEEMEWGDDE